jgi:hypothetical protein
MLKGFLETSSPLAKILFSLFIAFAGFIFMLVIAIIIAIPVFHADVSQIFNASSDLSNAKNIIIIKYLQLFYSIGLFVIPPFVLAWIFQGNAFEYLKLNRKSGSKNIIIVILLIICCVPITNLITEFNARMQLPSVFYNIEHWMKESENQAGKIIEAFLRVNTPMGLIVNLFIIGLVPALGEELLFRGILQRLFSDALKNIHLGILITSILFSAMHVQFYGFIPRMLLGMMFGYLLIWSDSLWLPILAHFINNSMAILFDYFSKLHKVNPDLEQLGTTRGTLIFSIISAVLVFNLLLLFYRNNKKNLVITKN